MAAASIQLSELHPQKCRSIEDASKKEAVFGGDAPTLVAAEEKAKEIAKKAV